MSDTQFKTIDAGEAVASVAFRTNEVIAIYPITPSSTMAEWSDAWMYEMKKNIWGDVPYVYQMQSEGGVAGGDRRRVPRAQTRTRRPRRGTRT
jgi:pyruvate-ferredoxin/flavodoxin oxidoreductase